MRVLKRGCSRGAQERVLKRGCSREGAQEVVSRPYLLGLVCDLCGALLVGESVCGAL